MAISIDSINLKNQDRIDYRTVSLDGLDIQSVNIHQSEGHFVVTEPLKNGGQIIVYPQSPNNPNYEVKTYREFSGYGSLYFPLDARYDFARRKLWIADAGNYKLLKLDSGEYRYELSISGLTLPHSVVPELNLGGAFVKTFTGINTGTVYYYDQTGNLKEYFSYPDSLGYTSTDIVWTTQYVKGLPLPSSMAYDHVRWRLWWTADSVVYMADLRNHQVSSFNLMPSFTDTRSVEIELNNGYVYVVAQGIHNNWHIVQIFRDNNRILDWAYAPIEV